MSAARLPAPAACKAYNTAFWPLTITLSNRTPLAPAI